MKKILASYDIHTYLKGDFDLNPDLDSYSDSKNEHNINNNENHSNPDESSHNNSFDSRDENISDNEIPESHFDTINQINNDSGENEPKDYFIQNERKNVVSMLGKKRNPDSHLEEKDEPEEKSKIKKNIEEKETKDTSAKIGSKNIKKKIYFITYIPDKKADYKKFNFIKEYKGSCQEYIIETSQILIKKEFPNEFNQYKIEKNSAFSEDGTLGKNLANLSSKIIDFYPLIKLDKRNKIKKEIFLKGLKEGELKNFLNKTLEELYKDYYRSENFKKFSSNKNVKRFDAQLRKETKEKFSLLKLDGFIKLLKNEY